MDKTTINGFYARSLQMKHYLQHIFFLSLLCLLSSCSHLARQDGPPNFYVDETKIPDAIPKTEPLAKYGNMHSYVVFGKRYYTMKSSKNYEAVGVASWYGSLFHARHTSSGERYNMLSMTAAHKTLPLPTYVEVTNLKNYRKVIVKVNDRGPFESNRLIDLSYVAAKKLGMLGHGTALVKVKAIDPRTFQHGSYSLFASRQATSITVAKNTRSIVTSHVLSHQRSTFATQYVYLQVGAFRNKHYAEKLRKRLFAMLATPITISRPVTHKLYRVQIGPIKTTAMMDKIKRRLQDLGIPSNKIDGV